MSKRDNERRLIRQILKAVQRFFGSLYTEHNIVNLDEFINKNIPKSYTEEMEEIKLLGYATKEMKIIWALDCMFRKESLKHTFINPPEDFLTLLKNSNKATLSSMSHLCSCIFSEFIMNRYDDFVKNGEYSIAIKSDWSLVLVPRSKESVSGFDFLSKALYSISIANCSINVAIRTIE